MRGADVEILVGACADAAEMRFLADQEEPSVTRICMRIAALENLLTVVTDILLVGTSADPDAGEKK